MSLRRTATVAAMHARDLARRRIALTILILLPLVFYYSAELQPVDPEVERLLERSPTERTAAELWILSTAAIGAGWAIAIAALFVMIGSRRADQPLLIAGFRPTELLLGRVLTVLGLAAVITPVFAVVIRTQRDVDLPTLLAAMALSAVVAVATGVLAAALVPLEMEGVLVIIGVVGIQMSGDPQPWMPMWGPGQLLQRAAGLPDAATSGDAVFHALAVSAALMAAGILLWSRRVSLRPPARVLSAGAVRRVATAESTPFPPQL